MKHNYKMIKSYNKAKELIMTSSPENKFSKASEKKMFCEARLNKYCQVSTLKQLNT